MYYGTIIYQNITAEKQTTILLVNETYKMAAFLVRTTLIVFIQDFQCSRCKYICSACSHNQGYSALHMSLSVLVSLYLEQSYVEGLV